MAAETWSTKITSYALPRLQRDTNSLSLSTFARAPLLISKLQKATHARNGIVSKSRRA